MSRNAFQSFLGVISERYVVFSPQPWLCTFSSKTTESSPNNLTLMPFGETVFISMRDSLDVECLCRIEKEKNALQAEGDDLSVSLETLQKQKVFLYPYYFASG